METEDIVIVGGGVMGASAAFWLTRMRPELRIRVIEADPTHARAATALSVASLRQQFSTPLNVRISRFGLDFIRNFPERTGGAGGVGSLGFTENGYLFLAGQDADTGRLRDTAAMQRREGARTEVLAPADLASRFPWLSLHDVGVGTFGATGEGWFDNMGLLAGLRAAARARGARFVQGRVAALEHSGGHIRGVRLTDGEAVSAGSVVLAAGTAVPALMRTVGLELPVEPRKRTVFVIDAPGARHPQAPLMVDHTGFYLRPEGEHWITATVPAHDPPVDTDDFDPNHAEFEEVIWPRLYARAPGFDAVKVLRYWTGHYDYNTLDQNAIVGPHPGLEGLYLLSGFSGHGLQQAPAMGRGLAEVLLSGRYETLDLAPLGAERILAGRACVERAVV